MAHYITDDFCEPVTIGPPNIITKDCLPEGDQLVCLYTIDLTVAILGAPFFDPLYDNGLGDTDGFLDPIPYSAVTYDLNKMVKVDDHTGIQQEFWLAETTGGDGDDYISGVGMLTFIDNVGDFGIGSVAQVDPSVYLGDLIHFSIDGGAGNDWIEGANNADILMGGLGDDSIYGLGGDDSIEGNEGNDWIDAGAGNDCVDGGLGDDTAFGSYGQDELMGGEGNDDLYGGDGNDNLDGGLGDDYLAGGNHDDWMSGGEGNDDIYGGEGDDDADGGAGNDYISMGAGNDHAVGGDGDDDVYGGMGDDKLDGQAGNDIVSGDDGNDLVDGGAGDDYVYGGAGDDIVRGGIGEDYLYGGEGCDVFVFCDVSVHCNDAIMDFSTGFDADRIDLSELHIDSIRVEETGEDHLVRLDLIDDGELVQAIIVQSINGANLKSVFEKDTAYGMDDGAIVQIGEGVMVDLPSTSVLHVESALFF